MGTNCITPPLFFPISSSHTCTLHTHKLTHTHTHTYTHTHSHTHIHCTHIHTLTHHTHIHCTHTHTHTHTHTQIMQEIRDNGIQIYTGEIDEEDDSKEIRELRVLTHSLSVMGLFASRTSSLCPSLAGCYAICCREQYHTIGGEREESERPPVPLGCCGR